MCVQPVVQAALEIQALAPLVVDLLALVFQRRRGRRALVGEGDGVETVQQRGQRQDRRIHRGDRDVAVPRAHAVVLEQHRRQLAADVMQRQSGALGAMRDQRRVADPGHPGLAAGSLDRLDRDQRILAAADRDQRAPRQAQRGGRWWRLAVARKDDAPAQVQPVAVGELGQAVKVQGIQQVGGVGVRRRLSTTMRSGTPAL